MTPISVFGIVFESELVLFSAVAVIVAFLFFNRKLLSKKNKLPLVILRASVIAAIFLVLATPYVTTEETITQETTSVIIVDDNSGSMSIFDSSAGRDLMGLLSNGAGSISKVESMNISTTDETSIGDAIYDAILRSPTENNAIILVSDGNNNHGAEPLDVAAFAAGTKTKIFSLVPEVKGREIYISDISGQKKVPSDSEYSGKVTIKSLGGQASYNLEVLVDGTQALNTPVIQNTPSKEFTFTKVFQAQGPHNITARIMPESDDTFPQNNVYNAIVDVIERPQILLVGSEASSPLKQILDEVYDVDLHSSIPSSMGQYTTIIMDDQDVDVADVDVLREFLNDGGGLVVVGGKSSYENGGYYESSFENLLPVRSAKEGKKTGEETNVVIVIDISGSTGVSMAGDTKIDVEKAIAVNLIRDLSTRANIGIVAFNSDSFLIQPIRKVTETGLIEERISRLRFGGGTYVTPGLLKARDLLRSTSGSKYIILLSDGVTNHPVEAFGKAVEIAGEGITVHTVGVGFDTDQSFMMGLANRGNGVYLAPTETERVRIMIGREEEKVEEDVGGEYSMIISDTHHFITSDIDTGNVSIEEFNKVSAKSSAQVLAMTQDLDPLLTVWRFGLGRVVSLTVDDGADWADKLYNEKNSKLISSAVNWAIGDPERKRDFRIECVDTQVGEEIPVIVTSDISYPQVMVGGEEMGLTRIDENNYYFDYLPTKAGFVSVESQGYSCSMGVSYPEEYGRFGADLELLEALAEITSGKVYQSGEVERLSNEVTDYTVSESTGILIKRKNMQVWFSLAALLLFFIDVAVRRLQKILEGRSGAGEEKNKSRVREEKGASKVREDKSNKVEKPEKVKQVEKPKEKPKERKV